MSSENTIFLEKAGNHPNTIFDEQVFLDLIENSLSLSVEEKKKVIDSIPILSQFQIDELTTVFEEEREEFKKLFDTEPDAIKELITKQRHDWGVLRDIYIMEEKSQEKQIEELSLIEQLRSSIQQDAPVSE